MYVVFVHIVVINIMHNSSSPQLSWGNLAKNSVVLK